MCTLAWRQHQDRLWICFNRDERRERVIAEAPRITRLGGNPSIFARDPEGGGSWFVASSRGFVVALLNNYAAASCGSEMGQRSRGALVLELGASDTVKDASLLLNRVQPEAYSPFTLFLLSREQVIAWEWDGDSLQGLVPDRPYWTSSSLKPEEVQAYRRKQLDSLLQSQLEDRLIAEVMRRVDVGAPEWGLTIDREKTRTVSQIELTFNEPGIRFDYRPRDPEGEGYLPAQQIGWPATDIG